MEAQLTTGSKQHHKIEHSLGRMSPQSTEIENAVLGIMMLSNRCLDIVSGLLTSDCFYSTSNKIVFDAIFTVQKKGRVPDILSVCDYLKNEGTIEACGGMYSVSKLTNSVTSDAGIEGHCKVIIEKHILRELIRINAEVIDLAYQNGADAFELLDYNESKIFDISVSTVSNEYSDLQSGMIKVIKKIEEQQQRSEDITGVPSGFNNLDRVTHGWQQENLIVIAARPSVGKSAFALNLARNAAMHETKPISVGFFSLEMSTGQLIQRILSAQSEIWLDRLKTGKMEQWHMDNLLKKGVMKLEHAKLFIDDTAGLSIAQFRSKARRMVMKDKVGLIIIDYLQLMKTGSKQGNREQEISFISRELKILSKELKIPIIALAQLSREVEKRASKVPMLSDLRESGAIEQDADIVGFLYRPSKEEVIADPELKGTAKFEISKHRDGALIDLAFNVDDNIQKWIEVGEMVAANNFQRVSVDFTATNKNEGDPF